MNSVEITKTKIATWVTIFTVFLRMILTCGFSNIFNWASVFKGKSKEGFFVSTRALLRSGQHLLDGREVRARTKYKKIPSKCKEVSDLFV